MTDKFLQEVVLGEVRPYPGSLFGKVITSSEKEDVCGMGFVNVTARTESGVVLVSTDSVEKEAWTSAEYLVLAVGDLPREGWHFRFDRGERTWDATWESCGITEGTVISVRSIAGVGIRQGHLELHQIRWDEIVAIGRPPEESPEDPCRSLPAPGWLMLKMFREESVSGGGIILSSGELADRTTHGHADRGHVVAFPRGLEDVTRESLGGADIGSTVYVPYHRDAGATEWVDFPGGYRAVPLDDTLAVLNM